MARCRTARSVGHHPGALFGCWLRLYTFLRSFYRDNTRATGWNNSIFPNVGMPHVLWNLQGQRGVEILAPAHGEGDGHGAGPVKLTKTIVDVTGAARSEEITAPEGKVLHGTEYSFPAAVGGTQNAFEYDDTVGDLVAFITYMSDPTAKTRNRLGIWVLIFIGIFFVAAWALNKAFWKDIR